VIQFGGDEILATDERRFRDAVQDGPMIAEMLVEITHEEAAERIARFDARGETEEGRPVYRCRHWDEETRLCGAYQVRPRMCVRYPYNSPCEHCGAIGSGQLALPERT
jgi:Fe-S-cluster containining protein